MLRLPHGNLPRVICLIVFSCGLGLLLIPAQRPSPVLAAPMGQIIVSTPMEDGAIVHIVQDGENLASIAEAYAVSMAEIRGLNGMAPTSNLIFPGQRLIIRLPQPPTETPTLTPTIPRPTRTPTVMVPSRTPRPTRTATPTLLPSATPNPSTAAISAFIQANQRLLLLVMLVICAAGLVWTLWAGFRPSLIRRKDR